MAEYSMKTRTMRSQRSLRDPGSGMSTTSNQRRRDGESAISREGECSAACGESGSTRTSYPVARLGDADGTRELRSSASLATSACMLASRPVLTRPLLSSCSYHGVYGSPAVCCISSGLSMEAAARRADSPNAGN